MKIGVVAGSFDPITNGHLGLIHQAIMAVDKLHIVVGHNPTKKYMFTSEERQKLIQDVLVSKYGDVAIKNIKVVIAEHELLVNYAARVGARYLIRGIRNGADYQYEAEMERINKDINPSIETMFFMPTPRMSQISSSSVKGLVDFEGAESTVKKYVHSIVYKAMKEKIKHERQSKR